MNGKRRRRRRRELYEHVIRMDAERLFKISKGHIPARRSPESPKNRWSDLILIKLADSPTTTKKKKKKKKKKTFTARLS